MFDPQRVVEDFLTIRPILHFLIAVYLLPLFAFLTGLAAFALDALLERLLDGSCGVDS